MEWEISKIDVAGFWSSPCWNFILLSKGKAFLTNAFQLFSFQFSCKIPHAVDRKRLSIGIKARGGIRTGNPQTTLLLMLELMRSWLFWECLQPHVGEISPMPVLLWEEAERSQQWVSQTTSAVQKAFYCHAFAMVCSAPQIWEHTPREGSDSTLPTRAPGIRQNMV